MRNCFRILLFVLIFSCSFTTFTFAQTQGYLRDCNVLTKLLNSPLVKPYLDIEVGIENGSKYFRDCKKVLIGGHYAKIFPNGYSDTNKYAPSPGARFNFTVPHPYHNVFFLSVERGIEQELIYEVKVENDNYLICLKESLRKD